MSLSSSLFLSLSPFARAIWCMTRCVRIVVERWGGVALRAVRMGRGRKTTTTGTGTTTLPEKASPLARSGMAVRWGELVGEGL